MATALSIGRSVLVEVFYLFEYLHVLSAAPMSADSPADYINSSKSLHTREIRSLILDAEVLCPVHPTSVMIGLATRSNKRSSATEKNTARRSCLLVYFMTFLGRESVDG